MHVAVLARAQVEDVEGTLAVVDTIAKRLETPILLLDPAAVYSPRHLESAILHAERAWKERRAAAKTLATEILLYLSGDHQVGRALERCGIRPGLDRVLVVAVGPKGAASAWAVLSKLGWSKDPVGVPLNPSALQRHGLAGPQDGDAEKRFLERVALVDLRK